MLEAITYESMLKSIKENMIKTDTIGILLTRPSSKTGKDIIESLPYFHHRSGRNINFYLPGYGAYWHGAYPDENDVIRMDDITWSFSNQKYVEFIEVIEMNCRWEYSGESELLLLEYREGKVDYSKVLRFHLDAMLRDSIILSINIFFESLFRQASKKRNPMQISDSYGLKILGQITVDSILDELPSFFKGIIKKERYYSLKNYANH